MNADVFGPGWMGWMGFSLEGRGSAFGTEPSLSSYSSYPSWSHFFQPQMNAEERGCFWTGMDGMDGISLEGKGSAFGTEPSLSSFILSILVPLFSTADGRGGTRMFSGPGWMGWMGCCWKKDQFRQAILSIRVQIHPPASSAFIGAHLRLERRRDGSQSCAGKCSNGPATGAVPPKSRTKSPATRANSARMTRKAKRRFIGWR